MAEGDGDPVLLLAVSIVLAVVVAGCMKSSDESAGSGGAQEQQGARQQRPAGPIAGAGAGTSMGAATATAAKSRMPARPVSARARALQRELGVPFGAAVTFATHHVLFDDTKHPHARWHPRPEALAVLRLLLEFADVFLLNEVKEHEEDELALKQGLLGALRAAGVARPPKSSGVGVEEHKILYYSTAVGKQAVARQVKPQLHIDYTREVVAYLVPHVPHLLLVRPFDGGSDGSADHAVPYRVVGSLGALLELLPPEEDGGGTAVDSG